MKLKQHLSIPIGQRRRYFWSWSPFCGGLYRRRGRHVRSGSINGSRLVSEL